MFQDAVADSTDLKAYYAYEIPKAWFSYGQTLLSKISLLVIKNI